MLTRAKMDADAVSRNEIIVLPDADVSGPEVDYSTDDEVIIDTLYESDDSDHDCQLHDPPIPETKCYTKNPKHLKSSWKTLSNANKTSKIPTFHGREDNFNNVLELDKPIQYFARHWTNAMSDLIVEQSNLFASQNGTSIKTTRVEINKFLGIIIKMELVGLPRFSLYWSKDFRMPYVSEIMARDRFSN